MQPEDTEDEDGGYRLSTPCELHFVFFHATGKHRRCTKPEIAAISGNGDIHDSGTKVRALSSPECRALDQ